MRGKQKVSFLGITMSCWYFQAMKSSGLLNPPFLFMYCLKNKYIKGKHYITVTLATLTDYIIEHQWESRDLRIETPAEVIGYNNSGWCWECSLWRDWKVDVLTQQPDQQLGLKPRLPHHIIDIVIKHGLMQHFQKLTVAMWSTVVMLHTLRTALHI